MPLTPFWPCIDHLWPFCSD